MISWIQHHLIRHGRWIFLSLLAVLIVAFVFTIGNTPGCTTDRSGYEESLFYGVDLNAPLKQQEIVEKVQLSAYLEGQTIDSDEQFQSQVYSRIALLNLANEIGVPTPNQESLANYITTKKVFHDENGSFSSEAYTSFVDSIESNPRSPQNLVVHVLEEDYRIDQISSTLYGPGFVLPSEALSQTQRRKTELSLHTANFSYSKFSPEISTRDTELKRYYDVNKYRYETPEKIKASYALFEFDRYKDNLFEASENELQDYFNTNRSKFVAEYEFNNSDTKQINKLENKAQTDEMLNMEVKLSDVREKVVSSFLAEQKSRRANEAAQNFSYTLYRDDIKRDSNGFKALIRETGLSLTNIQPYSLEETGDRGLSAELLKSAFSLGSNRYYSDAFPLETGYAVLLYEGRIGSHIPAFKTIKQEVTADYIADEKRRLFNEEGKNLRAQLEKKLDDGVEFTKAAEALELGVKTYETFSLDEAPRDINRSALLKAQSMEPGEVSPMITSGGTGTFIYLYNVSIPKIADDDDELAQANTYITRLAAYTSGYGLTNELVFKGISDKTKIHE